MFTSPQNLTRPVKILLLAIIAGYIAGSIWPQLLYSNLGLVPARVIKSFWIWQIVTYMFLHGGLLHLLFNMFAVYMFGDVLCNYWGEKFFVKYFFICGFGAAALTIATGPGSAIPTIGASGAIYGLLYGWAREFPNSKLYLYGILPVRAKHLVIFLFIMEFALSSQPSAIARFAHLGGLATGWLYFRFPLITEWLYYYYSNMIPTGSYPKQKRKNPKQGPRKSAPDDDPDLDNILDKISKHGMESLTEKEIEVLKTASKKYKNKH
ncbi:rhomboid family intramembrane serine protease [Elusimicrobiota bacterium]